MTEQCSECRFWESGGGAMGVCCKRAPVADPQNNHLAAWPKTFKTNWCGEYEVDWPKASKVGEKSNAKDSSAARSA
jgi:hypothetical protein